MVGMPRLVVFLPLPGERAALGAAATLLFLPDRDYVTVVGKPFVGSA